MTAQPEDTMADPYVEGMRALCRIRGGFPSELMQDAFEAKLRELFVPVDQLHEFLRLHAKAFADLVDQKAEMAAALEDAKQSLAVAIYGLPDMLERNGLIDEEGMVPALGAAVERMDAILTKLGGKHGQG